jgi:hypothetical protein
MGRATAAITISVVSAAMSLSWAAAGPAHAGDTGGGSLGGVVGGAGDTVGGTLEGTGGTVGGTLAGTGGTVGGTLAGTGGTVGGTVGGAGTNVAGTVGGAGTTVGGTLAGTGSTVGGATDHAGDSVGGGTAQQAPTPAPPVSHDPSPSTAAAPRDPSPPDSGPEHAASHAAVTRRGEDSTQASAERARIPAQSHQAHPSRPRSAAASAALQLMLAWARAGSLGGPAVGDPGGRPAAVPDSNFDESCQSASLAADDLRRCAYASMLIPQLGGPPSILLSLSLAMIGTGLVLVARRRRGDYVTRASAA